MFLVFELNGGKLMLSEKLTLSLTCLLLIFGLAIYMPSAMADHGQFNIYLTPAENMIDVSSDAGMQIASGRDRASRLPTPGTSTFITLLLRTDQIVQLQEPAAAAELEEFVENGDLQTSDIQIDSYDREGRALGKVPVADVNDIVTISHRDAGNPGKEFLIRIDEVELALAYADAGGPYEISTILFTIAKEKIERADLAYLLNKRDADGHATHTNNHVKANAGDGDKPTLRIDLVDDDEGSAAYNTGLGLTRASFGVNDATNTGPGVPGVVAIQSLREREGFIETGDFTVRVILTEEPKDGFKTDHVAVKNGSAIAVAKGTVLRGGLDDIAAVAADPDANPPTAGAPAQMQRNSDLTPAMVSYYSHAVPPVAGTAATMVPATTAPGDDGTYRGTGDLFPEPTGRDNQFHQYFVTIRPTAGYNGDVVVSVKAFDDKVLPVPNRYVPLTDAQIAATTLSGTQMVVRDARVMNETLTVRVNADADTTSKGALAKAAYDERQKVLDGVPNEITLANKTSIPAGGFLVLVADAGKAGIRASGNKINDVAKKNSPQADYVIRGLGLPFPADDLANFFRNGGTLNLGYQDIEAATGSGHDDSKAPQADKAHDDYTGYDGASTNAYPAGALLINEIMWGLDGNGKDSQYIEIHNPGATKIGIDNKEWVLSVGALPAGYAAIDTVSNNPDADSDFWEVPGSSGVTTVSADFPSSIDLVSMSRVAGSADGTLEASWAASARPSANLSGRRIGTPGAANNYVMPAPPAPAPAPETEPAPMAAPPAEADDIMISEVMVASNGGRLPQWVELANVSGAAVSLSGWSLVVENDAADAAVVGGIVEIDLGDTEIGEDQVALVVSKEGRNSGVGMDEGDLRADRIIDVQSMVSPDNARYSLISEMGFMLTLMPPQTGAVRMHGDSGGNLDMGWDVPMSEEGRSSLIRREMGDAGEIMGTDAAGWVLASDTTLDGAYRTTYYGSDEDSGTPGYNAGGALPVELSMFSAKRNDVGQVVITWETQSELNNAGFFIKRSQQKNGNFVVVNAAMVAGAGTTAEKQSYVYTDTTAQPNVVYYYQIEDVSLDGNRQTLTRAHRLKGHIGAAGKLTTIWGELKSQE